MTKISVLTVLLATLVVFGGLGCGQGASDDAELGKKSDTAAFCEEHQIAEAQCPFCDPSEL